MSPAAASSWVDWHTRAQEMSLSEAQARASAPGAGAEDWYVLGLRELDQYRFADADQAFARVLALDPNNLAARWGRAEVLRGQHDFAASVPILEQVLREDPRFAPALNSLAYIKYMQMSFTESSRLTGQVINLGEGQVDRESLVRAHGLYAAAKGMLAQTGGPLARSANFFAVQRHLRLARELDPESVVVLFGYGSYYMSIPTVLGGDLDKAREYLLAAVKRDPLFAEPYARLAQLAKVQGDEEAYQRYLDQALALDPRNEVALDLKEGTCRFICLEIPHNRAAGRRRKQRGRAWNQKK